MAVRRESVVLDLEDRMSRGLLTNAAAAKVLAKELNNLDGQAVRSSRSSRAIERDVDSIAKSTSKASTGINQLTGRLRLFADVAAILGPALVPLGGVGLAGVAGLASQFGFAAAGAGTALIAFQGVGDALKAMNKAALEPTTANLRAAKTAMQAISPEARKFVRHLQDLIPALKDVRDAGAGAMFPGLTRSLNDLEDVLPRVETIFAAIGGAMGDIADDSAGSLASDRWAPFLAFIADEAPKALTDLSAIIGDLAHGMSELWMAFGPMNSDFSSWMVDVADGFDKWAAGLAKTEGFAEFIDYIQTNGPHVADALSAIANMFLQIVEAAAPVGAVLLPMLEAVADAVAAIADSDLGTPIMAGVAALSLLNRALAMTKIETAGGLFGGVAGSTSAAKSGFATLRSDIAAASDNLVAFGGGTDKANAATARLKGQLSTVGKGAAPLLGLAAASGAFGETLSANTVSLGLMGAAFGPWGAAAGAAVGAIMDVKAEADALNKMIDAGLGSTGTDPIEELKARKKELEDNFGLSTKNGMTLAPEGGNSNKDVEAAASAYEAVNKAIRETTTSSAAYRETVQAETDAILYNIDAMRAKRSEAIAAANAELGYRGALLDARDAAKENGAVLKENGDLMKTHQRQGIESKGTLLAMASAFNAQSDAEKNAAGGARQARADFVEMAHSMGMSRDEARRLAKELFEIPTRVTSKVVIDTGAAHGDIARLREELNKIPDEEVRVRVVRGNVVTGSMGGPIAPGNAEGGTIYGQRQPYGDKVLHYLAPGEEVISNRYGQADRHREVLKAINSGRMAGGGTAGKGGLGFFDFDKRGAREDEHRAKIAKEAAEKQLEAAETLSSAAKEQSDAAKSLYESVKQQRESFEAAAANNFLGGNLDMSSLGAFDKSQAGQSSSSAAWKQTIAALTAAGLDGELLKEVSTGGSLKFANQLLAEGPAGIESREQMYAQSRASATSGASTAGVVAFGRQEIEAWNASVVTAKAATQTTDEVVKLQQLVAQQTLALDAAAEREGVKFSGSISKTAKHAGQNKQPKVGRW